MSFAADVKRELTLVDKDHCCQIAELSALLRSNGEVFLSSDGLKIDYQTQNPTIAKRVVSLLKGVYKVHVELITKKNNNLNKRNTYLVRITEKAIEIIKDLALMDGLSFIHHIPRDLVHETCDKRAYIRGSFISAGSVNDPRTSKYHLEILLKNEDHAKDLLELINEFDFNAKMITRNKGFMIYLKGAEKISDFLKLIDAQGSVMKYEDIRIYRDISNSINRINNCDIANQRKTLEAARKQIDDIDLIESAIGLESISEKIREAAILRKMYPDSSTNELIDFSEEIIGKHITKSGLNHRFRSLREIADKLR